MKCKVGDEIHTTRKILGRACGPAVVVQIDPSDPLFPVRARLGNNGFWIQAGEFVADTQLVRRVYG
jgi:hypothetical protein